MPDRDFSSTASIALLRQRAQLLKTLRAFFDERGFWEVETPLLSADTVVDRHIEPIEVADQNLGDHLSGRSYWLQTSPEFGMKRLLASGADAIYQIAKCFRGGESGKQHNPEFTMLEWYRVGDDYQQGVQLLSDLAEVCFEKGPSQQISYRDAFWNELQLDPHCASLEQFAEVAEARALGVEKDFSTDRDDWLDLLLTGCIQPTLGRDAPTILFDYPASQSALARERQDGSVTVAERFELFVEGVELANGYHELCDAETLRRRNAATNSHRRRDGNRPLPEDSRLLEAMEAGLPACCGCAMGVDRLVMIATGETDIEQVIPFPIHRA